MYCIFFAWNIIHDLPFFLEHLTWVEHSMCSFQTLGKTASSHSLMLVLAADLSPIITRLQQLFTFSSSSFLPFCFLILKRTLGTLWSSSFFFFLTSYTTNCIPKLKQKAHEKVTLSNQNFNRLQKHMWTIAVVLKLFFSNYIYRRNFCSTQPSLCCHINRKPEPLIATDM